MTPEVAAMFEMQLGLELELGPDMVPTGRSRSSQWTRRTLRFQAVPPSQRGDAPFEKRGFVVYRK